MNKNSIKNNMLNEKGATSVLVILMMIVLVTLGSFAIASANSNIKLSKTSANWNKLYYELDSLGEKYLSDIDACLYRAEINAISYINNEEYEELTHKDLPIELHIAAREMMEEPQNIDLAYYNVLNLVYYYYADTYIKELSEKYPENVISSLPDGAKISAIITDIILISPEEPDYYLNVSLEIRPLDYAFSNEGGNLTYRKSDSLRYSVISWQQAQIHPAATSDIEIWDGNISPKK
ncbi:hypothetical protein [Anaeropeptidivorans aminofermentans]|jgi:hypothetical protein|uniref:hypothetical protein n=1 Tax=Anaeropeptidivorans aminofermentans TaxID=2934315 RepID=UPI000EDED8DC|nr:hypothetical protein [Anaeropeptidivorans aminofermentans]HAQ41521.1 hypothetical protein [Clostridiales bacterium]